MSINPTVSLQVEGWIAQSFSFDIAVRATPWGGAPVKFRWEPARKATDGSPATIGRWMTIDNKSVPVADEVGRSLDQLVLLTPPLTELLPFYGWSCDAGVEAS